jgi:hypothetical protein
MKFRKKPVVIEAVQHWNNIDKFEEVNHPIPVWVLKAVFDKIIVTIGPDTFIHTLEGNMKVSDGDWIIKGVKGELYPCKPDIFEQTYEKAD